MKNRILIIVGAIVVLLVVGGVVWYAMSRNKDSDDQSSTVQSMNTYTQQPVANDTQKANSAQWQLTQDGWQSSGTLPDCPSPLLQSPIDVSKATSILYPGQTRGGNYKPHGGFRFDTVKNNQIAVTAPLDAQVVRGSRYIESGEVQYMFDFIAPCGYMYRFDHLLKLTAKYQALAEQFPAASADSRTSNINPRVDVKAGEEIATAVGLTNNTSVDFGVYDLRAKNSAAADATWAANPAHGPELAQHAVCWFDLLPTADAAIVKSLPAGDQASGKISDYCK